MAAQTGRDEDSGIQFFQEALKLIEEEKEERRKKKLMKALSYSVDMDDANPPDLYSIQEIENLLGIEGKFLKKYHVILDREQIRTLLESRYGQKVTIDKIRKDTSPSEITKKLPNYTPFIMERASYYTYAQIFHIFGMRDDLPEVPESWNIS